MKSRAGTEIPGFIAKLGVRLGDHLRERRVKDATVFISGGTGSFGGTMTRHLLSQGAAEIRVFSRDEAKQDAMRHELNDSRVRFYLGDVRDEQSVAKALKQVDLVFHAAALKQVPSGEFFPLEVVRTNILGSANVVQEAVNAGVKSVVCLSTDKAVYPINAMGMSKALMEKTALSFARESQSEGTFISVTRYGNVLASRGSVVPLFIRQLRAGMPITVTNLEMTRFLMTLTESVELVDYAFQNSHNGDLFVKKAPSSTVGTLLTAILELFNKPDHPVEVIGIRHGEKQFESLLSVEEKRFAEDLGGFYRVPLDSRDLNYSIYFDEGKLSGPEPEAYTSSNTDILGVPEVKQLLLSLPEVVAAL